MRLSLIYICCILSLSVYAQDYIESFSHNKDFRDTKRMMQYKPTPDGGIMSHNGKNLYTRALYGGNTLWRIETSDMPIFAAYHKSDNRNIHFLTSCGGKTLRLDSVANCTSIYKGGVRTYTLTDPIWLGGTLTIKVIALKSSESAIWQLEALNMPKDCKITVNSCATAPVKLSRSGDMGADPANAFAPHPQLESLAQCSVSHLKNGKKYYVKYTDRRVYADDQHRLAKEFDEALKDLEQRNSRLSISTPDPYINTLSANILEAGEGIWDGTTYLHGAVGWRMPLSGWRGAYTGDFLGWHDRARSHFDAYAASQVVNVEPVTPHPAQDSTLNLARALKKWGTQMYSNGYICRNPQRNNQMHHYDMNLCYIDQLLWHIQWTGDVEYAKKIWPVIQRHLQWEKRNFDPDDDGLYDAYCCIWASDALYYNSGGVTHSSAYNYRANIIAARIAELIGEDPQKYIDEADKILEAINQRLWLEDKGVWAEFVDFMGEKHVHTHPALWTVYHAIDSDIATPEQAFRATRYIDENIPHIRVETDSLHSDSLFVLSTSDWLPYSWSINNVAFAELYHTALAYYQAGRGDEATNLLKSAVLDGMFLGNSPGNIGQISHYDAARGECYRDFADPVGVLSRSLVQGLFGFTPRLLDRKIVIRHGFPEHWPSAHIHHPDFSLDYKKAAIIDTHSKSGEKALYSYHLSLSDDMYDKVDSITFIVPEDIKTYGSAYREVTVQKSEFEKVSDNNYVVSLDITAPKHTKTEHSYPRAAKHSDIPSPLCVAQIYGDTCQPVDISQYFNANITDIFRNRYLSPRSPFTTLQIPSNGIGEWCHPKDSANIDDTALRAAHGIFDLGNGIKFATPATGRNIIYTSIFDNYPTSVTVPVNAKGRGLALLMAGSTNHMQAYTENASVTIRYSDGTSRRFPLVPPYNWAPIEQDYFTDGKAFDIPTQRQTRIALKSGEVSADLGKELNIQGVYGRRIDGGAAVVLYLPVDPEKEMMDLTLTTHANEVVIGLAAVTVIR